MKLKFFNYSGTKFNYTEYVNRIVSNTNKKIYCEPFIGSGAIFFNLTKQFDHYFINDIDRNIVRIYNSFKDCNYDDYIHQLKLVSRQFGCIKSNKESYYSFRNWFNESHWDKNTTEEGIYLHFLANSCINSFLRFGSSGMNQSYGNRFYELDEIQFNLIKSKLQKTTILNESYENLFDLDACFFLDPPYFSQESSYSGFSQNDLEVFLSKISKLEFVYTDILNDYNSKSICEKQFVRTMLNTSPNTVDKTTTNQEYIFTNIKYKKLLEF